MTSLGDHLTEQWPIDAKMMGAAKDQFVKTAQKYALARGFKDKETFRYLDLMMLFGSEFHQDPQLPWAGAKHTMPELSKLAYAYVEKVAGVDGKLYRAALGRAAKLPLKDLVEPTWSKPAQATALLKQVHPEKFALLGNTELGAMFKSALEHAKSYDASAKDVRPLYVVLMFLLGSHFESDPRYAWAPKSLADTKLPLAKRFEALHKSALAAQKLAQGG
jgi:hypothetical protein